jgi:hypothetical protein
MTIWVKDTTYFPEWSEKRNVPVDIFVPICLGAHYQSLSWRYLGKGQLRGYATKPSKQPALTKEQKAAIVFPNEIQEIITGIILSDGSITMMGHDARLVIHQKDREFVQLIWDLFYRIGIVGAPPKEIRSIIKPSGNLLFLINSLPLPTHTLLSNTNFGINRKMGKRLR